MRKIASDADPTVIPRVEQNRGSRATRAISRVAGTIGSLPVILLATGITSAWVVGGFFVKGGFRNALYQLLITAGTNIIIFIMVFILQNSQNRQGRAVQTKLDAQGHALHAILDHLGIPSDAPLRELAGLEEGADQDIKKEQEQMRTAHLSDGTAPPG